METLERQVSQVRRRLFAQRLAAALGRGWFAALVFAAAAIGLGKLWPVADPDTWAVAWTSTALVIATLAALVWTWARRGDTLAAAVEIDRRCGLKERVSSSLVLEAGQRGSAAGQALVHDAEARLLRENVVDRFPLRPDRWALLPLAPAALAFALAVFVPMRSVETTAQAAAQSASPERQSTRQLAERIQVQRKEAAARGLDELDPLLAKLEQGAAELGKTAPNDRKQTLVALNNLVKQAQKRRDQLAATDDLKKQLSGLKNLKQGPAEKFGQALKQGDFQQAAAELEKLRQDLAAGKLDAQAQKQLAEQLEQMRQALAEKAAAQEKLARDLQEQIEAERRAGNLARADQLQQQLDKLAAQQPEQQQLDAMREKLEQAAQCMAAGDCQQAGEALAELGEQMHGLQQNLQEMEMLDGALDQVADCKRSMACSECQGLGCAACQGDQWNQHDGPLDDRFAHRGGGKGIGVGLGPGLGDETDPDGKYYDSRVKQQPGLGPAQVVGQADGPNRKGTVREEIQSEIAQGVQNAQEALGEQRLPRDYRDHAQRYFDTLREGSR